VCLLLISSDCVVLFSSLILILLCSHILTSSASRRSGMFILCHTLNKVTLFT
jgi:hypothetical protein